MSSEAPRLDALLAASTAELDIYAERVLDAARAQVVEFGLRRTSLDDIARAAEVGRATLFRRFPNRDALTLALASREAQASISRVDAQVSRIEDPEEFLVAGALAVIHELTGNDLLQRLLVTDPEQMLPLLTGRGAPIIAMGREYIAGQLRRIESAGTTLVGDPEVVAELLARAVLSLALNPEGVLPLHDDEELERLVRSTFVPMILGKER
jgi:AcrR family transcriptional regulator